MLSGSQRKAGLLTRCSMQDELAETQVPSPGYAGTKYEIDRESYDFDMFDFWDDLQYGDDEYWDNVGADPATVKTGQKRKRDVHAINKPMEKRRKIRLEDTGGDNVRFVSIAVRNRMMKKEPPLLDRHPSFALLPDWKERFADDSGVVQKKTMPEEMKKAAESKHTDSPPKKMQMDAMATTAEDEGEWEDDEDGAEDALGPLASLDPEILKGFLRQELGDGVLEKIDQGAFMQTIGKMLSGDKGAEDAIADLANSMLGQATEGEDTVLSGWLSQQGVSLDAAQEEEDETSSVTTSKIPDTSASKARQSIQSSPPDSAIEMLKGGAPTAELAIHPSSPSASAKKRIAPAEDQEGAKKRKKVTFDVPPSSESTQTAVVDDDEIYVSPKKSEVTDPPTSEDPLMSGSTIHDEDTIAVKTKTANGTAVKNNKSKSASVASKAKSESKSTKSAEPEAEPESADEIEVKPAVSAPAKNTRKRKAQVENDGGENSGPTQKKQARKGARTTNAEPPAKRTRSAQTKVGK